MQVTCPICKRPIVLKSIPGILTFVPWIAISKTESFDGKIGLNMGDYKDCFILGIFLSKSAVGIISEIITFEKS